MIITNSHLQNIKITNLFPQQVMLFLRCFRFIECLFKYWLKYHEELIFIMTSDSYLLTPDIKFVFTIKIWQAGL